MTAKYHIALIFYEQVVLHRSKCCKKRLAEFFMAAASWFHLRRSWIDFRLTLEIRRRRNLAAQRLRDLGGVKSSHSAGNLQYLWNEARYEQCYYWSPIRSRIRAFDWYQNQRPWMTLKGHYALCFKTRVFSEPTVPTTKIWMKIDPWHCQQRRCSPVTQDPGNIRFMRIFAGVPWIGASNNSGVIENVDFRAFATLRLRHLRKWGQHYYIVLFSALGFHHIWTWFGSTHGLGQPLGWVGLGWVGLGWVTN